jgi:hypothetical protein
MYWTLNVLPRLPPPRPRSDLVARGEGEGDGGDSSIDIIEFERAEFLLLREIGLEWDLWISCSLSN